MALERISRGGIAAFIWASAWGLGLPAGAQQSSLIVDPLATASPYSATIGTRRVFICRPNSPLQSVWGTDVYTDDTPICSAAVHAGVITQAQGGVVTIVISEGKDSYVGSTRNGVTSTSWATPRPRSYTFDRTTPARGQIDWGTSAAGLPPGFSAPLEVTCPATTATVVAAVAAIYGTDVYTDDSPICVAAVHVGLITLAGGSVQFVGRGAQSSFASTTRNGVTSRGYGAWDGSFTLTAPSTQTAVTAQTTGTLAVSPITSAGTPPAGARATSISTTDCSGLVNFSVKSTSNTSASISWQRMSNQCLKAAYLSGIEPSRVAVVRWKAADGSPCATSYDVFWRQFADEWPYKYIGDSRCTQMYADYFRSQMDDFGLEPDQNYTYRAWLVSLECHYPDCAVRGDLAPETSLKTLLFAPISTRPPLNEVLGLKATLGDAVCSEWYPSDCYREVTYTWKATAAAASYLLSFDVFDTDYRKFYAGGTYPIAASPSPSYKNRGEAGGALYACLGIVTDPKNPPDPRKGECILTDLPWP